MAKPGQKQEEKPEGKHILIPLRVMEAPNQIRRQDESLGQQPASRQGRSNVSTRAQAANDATQNQPQGSLRLAAQPVALPLATGASTWLRAALTLTTTTQAFTIPIAKAKAQETF